MAQIRTTTYVCDRCGGHVPAAKDLRKFGVQLRRGNWLEVMFDLCDVCEGEFLLPLTKFQHIDADEVNGMRRES
jgi:hypothetical protein